MKKKQCQAAIWHGPGHQSKTNCQVTGKHTIHEAVYGSAEQTARWRGNKVFSGFFDEPPENKLSNMKEFTGLFKCNVCGKKVKRTYNRVRVWANSYCLKTGKKARIYRVS